MANYREKDCVECGSTFKPGGPRQLRCDRCRLGVEAPPEEPKKRKRQRQHSPSLALRIEDRLRRRGIA